MKTVFVLFDSLNRRSLECYGETPIRTPNFSRLAQSAVTFDTHYVGSLACMPARREMLTGRMNFLHRSWGPIEPYDTTFPEVGHKAGLYSHLVSDHSHYWEDGGATYHTRYDSFDFIRGQEGDPWKAFVQPPWDRLREKYHPSQVADQGRNKFSRRIVNHEFIKAEEDFPSHKCFESAFEFLDINREADNWVLQLETFDPHEPFIAPDRFHGEYTSEYEGPILDWPPYSRVTEAPDECAELRANYCAIVAHCDHLMGRLLDYFDEHDLWKDTALVVTTDHGFLLGEHDWWAKIFMPCYNEIAHIPLFIHHPDFSDQAGTRRQSLTQTIDLAPSFLDFHNIAVPNEMDGKSLRQVLDGDQPIREAGIYGVFGSAVNVTDGRYSYFHYPADLHDGNLNQYTLMPAHMTQLFSVEELADAELTRQFSFSKGAPLLKIPSTPKSSYYLRHGPGSQHDTKSALFDLQADPDQLTPIDDPETRGKMIEHIRTLMAFNEAPPEAYVRLQINP